MFTIGMFAFMYSMYISISILAAAKKPHGPGDRAARRCRR